MKHLTLFLGFEGWNSLRSPPSQSLSTVLIPNPQPSTFQFFLIPFYLQSKFSSDALFLFVAAVMAFVGITIQNGESSVERLRLN
ncbi:unnamed protein product [Trifolium pratense]|uniref:Uncharacterized protein n=1 Tax=Trifolium pratense TaxID=57577 RepID=A0ACB0JW06_TRIPR|nr:unnamed protein product [Trifolium pratense]